MIPTVLPEIRRGRSGIRSKQPSNVRIVSHKSPIARMKTSTAQNVPLQSVPWTNA